MAHHERQVSLHGRRAFITKDNVTVSRNGFAAGGEGKPLIVLPGSPDHVAVFSDFIGPVSHYTPKFDTGGDFTENQDDWLPDEWAGGFQDTGQKLTKPAIAHGVARLTSSASSGQTPITGALSIHGEKNFKANTGNLRMGARVKIETLAGTNLFVGFTDTGGSEMPVYDTGSEVTATLTPAADFVGWLFSAATAATALGRNVWRGVSSKNGTDQILVTTQVPVANVYDVPEVEVDTSGNAHYYLNGKYYGSLTAAITATVGLAPAVYQAQTEAAAKYVDVDWINVSASRDTGE